MTGFDARALDLLERLPLAPSSLERAAREAGLVDEASLALLRAANRQALLLSELPRPVLPAPLHDGRRVTDRIVQAEGERSEARLRSVLDSALRTLPAPALLLRRDFLARCYEAATEGSADRLRDTPLGDALAEGIAPRTAPRDADWATVALEELESSHGAAAERVTFGDRTRTPGWLWSRIRGDVRDRVLAFRRRRAAVRATLIAAALMASALVYAVISEDGWLRRDSSPAPTIVFERVEFPLSDQFSTTAVVRRMRDVR